MTSDWKDIIRRAIEKLPAEIKFGGSETPCPFCKVPRVKRSDYIRCCRCGINWLNGEALDRDPRSQRLAAFLDSFNSTQKPKEAKNAQG